MNFCVTNFQKFPRKGQNRHKKIFFFFFSQTTRNDIRSERNSNYTIHTRHSCISISKSAFHYLSNSLFPYQPLSLHISDQFSVFTSTRAFYVSENQSDKVGRKILRTLGDFRVEGWKKKKIRKIWEKLENFQKKKLTKTRIFKKNENYGKNFLKISPKY